MEDENRVVPVIKSVIGNAFALFLTLVGVAFLAGIPLGMTAHKFYNSMFSPSVPVFPEK